MSIRPGSRGREPIVGHSSLEAPFVGRTAELETLLGALDEAVREGQPRYVLVDGAAGIGKSRLVREFLSAARSRASAAAILQERELGSRPVTPARHRLDRGRDDAPPGGNAPRLTAPRRAGPTV